MPLGRTEREREMMQLGARLAVALPQLKSQAEVGAELGVSREAIRQMERRALAKIATKLKEIYDANPN